MFGEKIVGFNLQLVNYVSTNQVEKAKEYVKDYFIKVYDLCAILMWSPNEKKMTIMTYEEAKKQFIKKNIKNGNLNYNIGFLNKTKQGQHANAADDIMTRKKNVRLVMTTEPDSQINLKTNKLRQWSGKDPIQCRALYGKSLIMYPNLSYLFNQIMKLVLKVPKVNI